MKHLYMFFLLIFLLSCKPPEGESTVEQNDVLTIGITQIASHPSLDSVREGIIEGLRQRGYVDGKNILIKYENANSDNDIQFRIIQDFVKQEVDLIVPITTPSAIAAKQVSENISIVFAGVTDPIGAGLVNSLGPSGENITGTSDRWPFEKQLLTFVKLMPSMKSLGMLYSPSDNVSEIAVKEMGDHCKKHGIELITIPISRAEDIYPSARRVLLKASAIYTGLDTLVVENIESVIKAAEEAGKPIFSGDTGTVAKGALATYSIDMREIGIQASILIDSVLRGEDPGKIPVKIVDQGAPMYNFDVAKKMGIKVP